MDVFVDGIWVCVRTMDKGVWRGTCGVDVRGGCATEASFIGLAL